MFSQRATIGRRYALFAVLSAVGCAGEDAKPQSVPTTSAAQSQAPQLPQQTQPAAATEPVPSAGNSERPSAGATPPQQAAPSASAMADAAMPATHTPAQPNPMGMSDAAVRAADAALPAQQMAAQQMPSAGCDPRKAEGPAGVHFHHIHFNTTDPSADIAFYEKYFGAMSVDFCTKQAGAPATRATRTERGYFLYSKVATAPDPSLNAYLEHIGWCHPDPASELQRQVMLGAPLWPSNPERGQCETAAAGKQPCNDYWYYLQAPSGARIEIALGPGPATMGFGHIHVMMGEDLTWYKTITGGRYTDTAIDMVNITNVLENESYLANEKVTDTRGKPIDHIGFSTSTLEAERDRIEAAGIEIAEDISFKPEYGFRSFFIKSAKGIWVEMVEDSAFTP